MHAVVGRFRGFWRELERQMRAIAEAEPTWIKDDLRRIPLPTLLITGETDFFVDPEQTLAMRRSPRGRSC